MDALQASQQKPRTTPTHQPLPTVVANDASFPAIAVAAVTPITIKQTAKQAVDAAAEAAKDVAEQINAKALESKLPFDQGVETPAAPMQVAALQSAKAIVEKAIDSGKMQRESVVTNKLRFTSTQLNEISSLNAHGIKAQKVLVGDNGKVAIIGRSMGDLKMLPEVVKLGLLIMLANLERKDMIQSYLQVSRLNKNGLMKLML